MIGVLGPPVVVTSAGRRTLNGLAGRLLVSLAGAQVPMDTDRLSEILWGDSPPATARAAFHVHLAAVRRALAGCGDGDILERSDAGYRLRPDGWHLDADLAAGHATRARGLLDESPVRALEACRAALLLWRGPAFSVGGEVVAPIAAQRAEALHREVQELEATALLAAGDAGEAERVALRLVDEEPYRELRWAQLLRARYQSGRSRDALATYQDARRVLAEGLGVEPGPLLRDLERAVLTHDEALLTGKRPPGERHALPPPARSGPVFGRARDLDRCGAALGAGRPVVIYGPPGVGKTTLAIELAHEYDPSTVVWVDLRVHSSADDVLGELITVTHLGAAPSWARTGAVNLVVLDNAEDLAGSVADVVRRLVHVAPGVGLVVTSRARVPVDAVFLPLAPLPVPGPASDLDDIDRSPAVQLLRAALADLAPGVRFEPAQELALCTQTGGLPMALRLAAAAARGVPATHLTSAAGGPIRDGVLPAVASTVALLDEASAVAFPRLAILRQAFGVDLAAAVCGLDEEQVRDVLVTLTDHGLVQISSAGSAPYSLVEPLRDAAEQLLLEAGRTAAWAGLIEWSLRRARSLRQVTLGDADGFHAAATIADDLPHFRRVMDRLVAASDHERALRLARLLDTPLYLGGRWPERNHLLDQALSVEGPESKDRALVLASRSRPGPLSALDRRGLDAALNMAVAVGADGVAACARHLRGIHNWWEGDLDAALADHREAAEWFEEHGNPTAVEVRKYEALALVHGGEFEGGIALLRRVALAYRQSGTKALHAHTLAYLGHCHRFVGDDDAALANWQEAWEVLTTLANHATVVHVELGLGELAVERGSWGAGAHHAGAALDRISRSRNAEYEAWGWTVAMRAAAGAGDIERALGCARSGIDASDHVLAGEAGRLAGELAIVAAARGDWRHAARLLGCADAHGNRRELSFAAPSEGRRWAAVRQDVRRALGETAEGHIGDGRRCTVGEAAGDLIVDRRRTRRP